MQSQENNTYPAPVAKTGQTTSYSPRDDGDLQKGVAWPKPRFTDNDDESVTDNLTGLIWLKKADNGPMNWTDALAFSNKLPGDWRLPNRFELESLLDLRYARPALSNTDGTGQWAEGDPFTGVQSNYYWSSTTWADHPTDAWSLSLYYGHMATLDKSKREGDIDVEQYGMGSNHYVWPVRGGQ